ncbi:MAG: hypothetical protein L0Y71_00420 [Gemmataceae bacterium]|nr:hypothetical protein [Gemmataceae bacterium]
MTTGTSWRRTWRARIGVSFLALGWIAAQHSASWGQKPSGGATPTPVTKPGAANPVAANPGRASPAANPSPALPGAFHGGAGGIPVGPGGNVGSGFGGSGFSGFSGVIVAPQRFTFKIDPNTPVDKLLPAPPVLPPPRPPWLVRDLTQVPEVFFEKPMAIPSLSANLDNKTDAEKASGARSWRRSSPCASLPLS